MALTNAEIAAALEAKRKAEEAVEKARHLINPETVRALGGEYQRLKDVIDPPALRIFREQQHLAGLVEPATAHMALVRDTMASLDTPAVRALMDEQFRVSSVVQEVAASLSAANSAIAHSVFASDFVENMRRLPGDYDVGSMKLAFAKVAEQFQPIALHQDMAKLAEMFGGPVNLTGFYDSFKGIEEITRAAQSLFGTVRLECLGDLIGVVDPAGLQRSTLRLNASYADFAASTAAAPETVIELPFMAKVPALAVYSHARVMRSITSHDGDEPVVQIWNDVQEETTALIETVLPRVMPALLPSWKGGLATVRRRGDDWVRQASASFRYVLVTTLDRIAPKDRVLADGVDKKHLSGKGEPTRAAQVHWLCRTLKNKNYREMMVSELESAIETIDTMSEAVHRENYAEIEEAFDRMCVRVAVALRDLLEIFESRD
jgi:hypothetical protein